MIPFMLKAKHSYAHTNERRSGTHSKSVIVMTREEGKELCGRADVKKISIFIQKSSELMKILNKGIYLLLVKFKNLFFFFFNILHT